MGKAYDHKYYRAGSGCSAGTMVCAGCGKAIDGRTQEWRCYARSKHGDWGYVTHHRACSADDIAWARLDERDARDRADYARLRTEAAAFATRWAASGYDIVGVFEDITSASEVAA